LADVSVRGTIGGVEPLISHNDITTIMDLLAAIRHDVQRIRILLEEDNGEEAEEGWEPDS
jgi:hypothetical protein